MKKICWRRGAGTLFLGLALCMLELFLMIMIIEFSSIQYTATVAMTRTDAIADSAAVYAQSYDYKYNKRQAESMTELLTKYNNDASNKYKIDSNISFSGDDVLSVSCTASTKPLFPNLFTKSMIKLKSSAKVKSVDIYGDIFVVPGSVGEEQHKDMNKKPGEVVNDGEAIQRPN